jgi:hypothetical protein
MEAHNAEIAVPENLQFQFEILLLALVKQLGKDSLDPVFGN